MTVVSECKTCGLEHSDTLHAAVLGARAQLRFEVQRGFERPAKATRTNQPLSSSSFSVAASIRGGQARARTSRKPRSVRSNAASQSSRILGCLSRPTNR
jgi:hypothetical protein